MLKIISRVGWIANNKPIYNGLFDDNELEINFDIFGIEKTVKPFRKNIEIKKKK